jgi:hypothetical protein
MIADVDTDGSGFVDYEEFSKLMMSEWALDVRILLCVPHVPWSHPALSLAFLCEKEPILPYFSSKLKTMPCKLQILEDLRQ